MESNLNKNNRQRTVPFFSPAPLVEQGARENFAMDNGGVMPPQQVQPVQAPVQPTNVFSGGGVMGRFEQPVTPKPLVEEANPDLGSTSADSRISPHDGISAALNGMEQQNQPSSFQKDDSKRDGGFFGWLRGLMPRKGMREGETVDEYDKRRTENMKKVALFADAIRHIGNIVNTSHYAPSQQFNDPVGMLEKGYQQRKADRQKKEAMDAERARKDADFTLKSRAQMADEAYKQFLMGMRQDAAGLNRDKFNYQKDRDADKTEYQRAKDKRDFEYKKDRDEVKDEQANKRLQIAQYNATHKGRGGSGGGGRSGSSGGKYWFIGKDGKYRYQPNKTMWEQEYYREYGSLPNETSTSTSTKSTDYKTGKETTQTTRTKGIPMAAQAARQQNAAQQARKNASKPSTNNKNKGGKPSYSNTKKLGW